MVKVLLQVKVKKVYFKLRIRVKEAIVQFRKLKIINLKIICRESKEQ